MKRAISPGSSISGNARRGSGKHGASQAAARNARDEEFGEERIRKLAGSLPHDLPAREVAERILAELRRFLGKTQPQDDVTLLVLQVRQRARAKEQTAPAVPARSAT